MTPAAERPYRVFLLSPAKASGERARMVLNPAAEFPLAVRLRRAGAPLGEVFAFSSGLYFRGKLAYSEAFASAPPGVPGALVITPGRGLVPPWQVVTVAELEEMARVPVDATVPHYREPLARHARILYEAIGSDCALVLLGSVATPKYLEPLLDIFGCRQLFPAEFVGRGDMSRGGLLLRCAAAGVELNYVPALNSVRHGPRPPKLPRPPRTGR